MREVNPRAILLDVSVRRFQYEQFCELIGKGLVSDSRIHFTKRLLCRVLLARLFENVHWNIP
jgi:hypothetical protein